MLRIFDPAIFDPLVFETGPVDPKLTFTVAREPRVFTVAREPTLFIVPREIA